MKLVKLQDKLLESGLNIFSSIEFRRAVGASNIASQKLLERYTKKGLFVRLKPGLYSLKIKQPPPYLIANRLYEPSYISFETALSYYRIIPETVYSYTSATTKTTREFLSLGAKFIYHKIKKPAFIGYKLTLLGGINVFLAEKEKALADYLYFIYLKKKVINERLSWKGINIKKLIDYAEYFENPGFLRWLKCLIKTK